MEETQRLEDSPTQIWRWRATTNSKFDETEETQNDEELSATLNFKEDEPLQTQRFDEMEETQRLEDSQNYILKDGKNIYFFF